ncbi:DUF1566 [Desulfonema limicola]|uniref:DUF1566 n=1 Tax=Desulfonema limicola TaxID=45656 RepID=A0A975B7B5_9BACT|nr:DUF1566 domain-containing protein [Desulfonema limicola]QTA80027.1 DUF1566 [Desulfonema limicola]
MYLRTALFLIILFCVPPFTATAGNIDSPGTAPSVGSGMYTMDDLYNYLMSGTAAAIPANFKEPAAGPGDSSKTINDIHNDIKANFELCNAAPDKVMNTVTFFSTIPATWGPQTGTLSTQALSSANDTVSAGYYEATTLSAVDADLTAANIKTGMNIFGVTGTVIESAGDASAADVLTGKTFSNAAAAGVSGSMTNVGQQIITPAAANAAITQGYHDGTGYCAGDADLTAANIKTGMNIFGVTGTVIESRGDASAGDVLTGKTFSNGIFANVAGSMTNVGQQIITPAAANTAITQGYHDGTGYCAGDASLVTGNIKSGTSIFGVAGKTEVVDTTSGDAVAGDILLNKKAWVDGLEITGTAYPAPVAKTGQTTSYAANDDGSLQKGVTTGPRFTDNGDGTVTDNLTGLIWLKNANCFGLRDWSTALTDCSSLANGSCGLTDGSAAGDWRLPNVKELLSLIDFGYILPALSNAAGTAQWAEGDVFTSMPLFSDAHWSSTTSPSSTDYAWYVYPTDGTISYVLKTETKYVWPVRGGQ